MFKQDTMTSSLRSEIFSFQTLQPIKCCLIHMSASLKFTQVSFAQQIGPRYRCLKPQGTQTNASLDEFSRLTSQKSSSQKSYNTLGVVNVVQLYFGLFVCANGRTGGSIRYHVSRTTVASCATDMAQYGILCKIS